MEVGQVPIYYNHDTTGRPQAKMGEYRDAPTKPMFNFGFGMNGYTVRYSEVTVPAASAGKPTAAVATVTNTGSHPVDEVVQLYVRQLACSQGARPAQELRGFQHVTLAAGESKDVSFPLTDTVLGYFQRDGRFVTDAGDYHVWIAPQAGFGTPAAFHRQ